MNFSVSWSGRSTALSQRQHFPSPFFQLTFWIRKLAKTTL
jgi:hypothetical protein